MRLPLLFACMVSIAVQSGTAQAPVRNSGFEDGTPGEVPPGWIASQPAMKAGFSLQLTTDGCRTGQSCVIMSGPPNPPPNLFNNLSSWLPAAGYTMHRVRYGVALRVQGIDTRAQLWLRFDRADGSMAFLDNMGARPVFTSNWTTWEIEANVPGDVDRLVFGVMAFGPGTVWVDDVSLKNLNEVHSDAVEPARPVTGRGLVNLTAFARLYGYVRFFHPSDQVEKTDWEDFAIAGVRRIEQAAGDAELVACLNALFLPIAPAAQVFITGRRPAQAPLPGGPEAVRIVNFGVGLPSTTLPNNAYKSSRRRQPTALAPVAKTFESEIAPGISVSVPLSLPSDAGGTLPHVPMPTADYVSSRSADDRATRLGDIVISWNVFQHFYPYFDVAGTDWLAELTKAMSAAATDGGAPGFDKTLRRLVAALHDGHGNVHSPGGGPALQPPLTFDWVGNQFIVTRVQQASSPGFAPGDRVLKIDGKPLAEAFAERRQLISGATEQWIRYRSIAELSACNPLTRRMAVELEPFAKPGTSYSADLACGPVKYKDAATYTEPRPDKIAELEPGIFYVDLERVTDLKDWAALVPRLDKATGIVFDMRGYPGTPGIQALSHLTNTTIRSAKWNIATPASPDRLDSTYTESGWDIQPQKPYFTARRVFLTDGRAISYAETVMGIVEAYKLGEIVGEPTAGTNGNVNPFTLPGGYTINWTGMKVLKHDGSQHHGIGIQPSIPASRTRKGVAQGKDDILLPISKRFGED